MSAPWIPDSFPTHQANDQSIQVPFYSEMMMKKIIFAKRQQRFSN